MQDLTEVRSAYEGIFFGVVNHFLACCPLALARYGLRPVHTYDQFIPPLMPRYGRAAG